MSTAESEHLFDSTVLELIAAHDGQWGWYQLDRALAMRGIVGFHVPNVIEELAKEGLIEYDGPKGLASTRYRITESGKRRAHGQDAGAK